MKVKELIEELKNLNPEADVVLSKDGEGNSYSPVDSIGIGYYIPWNSYSGDFYNETWDADECCMDEQEWNEMRELNNAIVLWPTN